MLDGLRWFTASKLPKYPHLGSRDAFTANLYWQDNILNFDKVSYDVPVGGGRDADNNFDSKLLKDWKYLSSLKIDMLGSSDNVLTIVEFKSFADVGAIGQVLTYSYLFVNKFAIKTPPNLCIICIGTHQDIIRAAKSFDINLIVCTPNGPSVLY